MYHLILNSTIWQFPLDAGLRILFSNFCFSIGFLIYLRYTILLQWQKGRSGRMSLGLRSVCVSRCSNLKTCFLISV